MRKFTWLLLLVGMFFCASPIQAEGELERQSLIGLRGFHLTAKNTDVAGQNSYMVIATAEQMLKEAGMKTFGTNDYLFMHDIAMLSVDVNQFEQSGKLIYVVTTKVIQSATLERDPTKSIHAVTWQTENHGTWDAKNPTVKSVVQKQIALLIKEYKTAQANAKSDAKASQKPAQVPQ